MIILPIYSCKASCVAKRYEIAIWLLTDRYPKAWSFGLVTLQYNFSLVKWESMSGFIQTLNLLTIDTFITGRVSFAIPRALTTTWPCREQMRRYYIRQSTRELITLMLCIVRSALSIQSQLLEAQPLPRRSYDNIIQLFIIFRAAAIHYLRCAIVYKNTLCYLRIVASPKVFSALIHRDQITISASVTSPTNTLQPSLGSI